MSEVNYYTILEVQIDSDARTIQIAYRRLARKYHPDAGGPEASLEKMKLLNQAYEVLSDPGKRQIYDSRKFHTRKTEARPPSRPVPPVGPFTLKLIYKSNHRLQDVIVANIMRTSFITYHLLYNHYQSNYIYGYDSNWLTFESAWARTFRQYKYYYISVLKRNCERYSYISFTARNFEVSVEMELVDFTLTTEVGFVYRVKIKDGREEYSRITIRPDGYCMASHILIQNQKIIYGQIFSSHQYDANLLRSRKNETNTLNLRVFESYVEFRLNGKPILIIDDGNPEAGITGIFVRSNDDAVSTVRFTNFQLYSVERTK